MGDLDAMADLRYEKRVCSRVGGNTDPKTLQEGRRREPDSPTSSVTHTRVHSHAPLSSTPLLIAL